MKLSNEISVWQATQNRLNKIFTEFDNIYVSFSGGKDSGVLLNLCIDFIRKNNLNRKIGVFHIDYEAQYQMTTDYVDAVLSENSDIIDVYRICLPLATACATSMHQSYWLPWEEEKKDIWVRPLPENSINESNQQFDFFTPAMRDYDFQERFSMWLHEKNNAKKTCCLVGIRTQESFNRWRALHSNRNQNKYEGNNYLNQLYDNIYNGYPIYDWTTEDIWIANGQNEWSYNKLYDVFYQAGLTIDKMRVASPFHDSGIENLKLYRVIEPNTWGKMVGRVNGVNFSGIYGGTTAMGWREIKLPPNHTWKSYMEFLLSTLPKETAENYKKKLQKSIEFWKTRGGVLSTELIEKLRNLGIEFELIDSTNYKTDKLPVRMDYLDDIDIPEFREIPTYKRMCVCIMKNDHLCKYMGFSLTKTEMELRTNAEKKYKNL